MCIINFDEKWVGLHFGRDFHKLVLSPWPGFVLFSAGKKLMDDILIWQSAAAPLFVVLTSPGLPDGIFSNQKNLSLGKFWSSLN
jgi:hypothetical protein